MPEDNWQHRSAGLRCSSCLWYSPKPNTNNVAIGRCRKHAPTLNGFPVVYGNDWCGDHKVDEHKLPEEPRKVWHVV